MAFTYSGKPRLVISPSDRHSASSRVPSVVAGAKDSIAARNSANDGHEKESYIAPRVMAMNTE